MAYVACYPFKWQRLQNALYDITWPLLTGMSFHFAIMLHLRIKHSEILAVLVLCVSWVVLWFVFMLILSGLQDRYGLTAKPVRIFSFTPGQSVVWPRKITIRSINLNHGDK